MTAARAGWRPPGGWPRTWLAVLAGVLVLSALAMAPLAVLSHLGFDSLNALVIGLNGGRMPVSERALVGVTHLADPEAAAASLDARHFIVGPNTRLGQMGDVVAVSAWGIGAALSPGDLLMALGLAGFVQGAMCGERCTAGGA